MSSSRLFLATLGVALLPLLGAAEPVQLRTDRVALFKNGYSQVSLLGELPANKRVELRGLPVPVAGSLWWHLPAGAKLVQVEGSIREREVAAANYSTEQLLAANVGKSVRLVMSGGQVYEGVLTRQPLPEPAALTYPNHSGSVKQQRLSQQAPVFLKNAHGELQEVALGSVLSVSFAEPPAVPMAKELQPLLTMELQEPAAGGALRVECLAGGLSWSPSYRLDISGEATASLSCMAIIANDMVDLEQVHLELVTGDPELGSDGLPISPLTRLHSMANRDDAYRARSMFVKEAPSWKAKDADDEGDDDDESFCEAVTRTQELYHYAIPNFSAQKDSTVAREIFTQTPACRHLYTCDLSPHQRAENEATVWHCVALTNNASWPWSPGTLVCYSGDKLLARTSLKATAPGQETRLRLATTPEIKVTQREVQIAIHPLSELDTARAEVKSFGASAKATEQGEADDEKEDPFEATPPPSRAKVDKMIATYKGSITLQNNADHPVEIELKKTLSALMSCSMNGGLYNPGGLSVQSSAGDNNVMTHTWVIKLTPGESRTVTYSYGVVK